MWKLAVKDIYLQSRKLLWLVITAALVVGILVSINVGVNVSINGVSFLPAIFIFGLIASYSFTIQTCFYEDKNRSMAFLRALPLSAGEIVTGRFLALAMVTAGALILGFGVLFVIQVLFHLPVDWFQVVVYGLSAGLLNWFVNCLAVFLYVRWGFSRMQFVYRLAFGVIFFGAITIGNLFPGLSGVVASIPALCILIASLLLSGFALWLVWQGSVAALGKQDLD